MTLKNIIFVILLSILSSVAVQSLAFRHPDSKATSDTAYDRVMARGSLKCAYIPYPPYFDMDPVTHQPTGLVADLMNEVGQKLNLKIEWTEEVGWGSMIEGLKAKRYDAVCSAIWQNATRAVHVDFSVPYGYAAVDAWVRADDERFTNNIESFDKKDTRISTVDGEMSDILSRNLFAKAQRVSLPQNAPFSDVMMQVTTGKADIALVEPSVAADFLKSNPGTLKNITENNPVAVFPITVMLPKGDTRLKAMIDAAIEEVIYTRKLDALRVKYSMSNENFFKPAKPF